MGEKRLKFIPHIYFSGDDSEFFKEKVGIQYIPTIVTMLYKMEHGP